MAGRTVALTSQAASLLPANSQLQQSEVEAAVEQAAHLQQGQGHGQGQQQQQQQQLQQQAGPLHDGGRTGEQGSKAATPGATSLVGVSCLPPLHKSSPAEAGVWMQELAGSQPLWLLSRRVPAPLGVQQLLSALWQVGAGVLGCAFCGCKRAWATRHAAAAMQVRPMLF